MSHRNKRNLAAGGFCALALVVLFLGCPQLHRPRSDAAGDSPTVVLTGHTFPVQALAFAPDGSTLTSAALFVSSLKRGGEVTVWDVRPGSPRVKKLSQAS